MKKIDFGGVFFFFHTQIILGKIREIKGCLNVVVGLQRLLHLGVTRGRKPTSSGLFCDKDFHETGITLF